MAINPETQYPGKVEPATPANPFGTARNITTPGDGTGTPWESAIQKDNWAFQHAMLLNAGMEPNGTPDVADNSQLFKAAKASIGNGANLLSNHNFLIASPDDSQPPPDATPRSYPPGFQIFSGVFANETTGITDLTYIDGRVSFTAGDFYIPRANSKELENVTEFVASVADFDGKPRTRGVSFALVGDEYRVTVGVDALEDTGGNATPIGSVKFEQGSIATVHQVQRYQGKDYTFNSVSEMIAASPQVGSIVKTVGYYNVLDGGGASYLIIDGDSGDGVGDHSIGGKTALLIVIDDQVNVKQLGLNVDGVNIDDWTGAINYVIPGAPTFTIGSKNYYQAKCGLFFNGTSIISTTIQQTKISADSNNLISGFSLKGSGSGLYYAPSVFDRRMRSLIATSNTDDDFKCINLEYFSSHRLENFAVQGTYQNTIGIYRNQSPEGVLSGILCMHHKTGFFSESSGITVAKNCEASYCSNGGARNFGSGDSSWSDCYFNTNNPDYNGDDQIIGAGITFEGGSNNCNYTGGKNEWNSKGLVVIDSQGINVDSVNWDVNLQAHIYLINSTDIGPSLVKSINLGNANRFLGGGHLNSPGKNSAIFIETVGDIDVNIAGSFRKGSADAYDDNPDDPSAPSRPEAPLNSAIQLAYLGAGGHTLNLTVNGDMRRCSLNYTVNVIGNANIPKVNINGRPSTSLPNLYFSSVISSNIEPESTARVLNDGTGATLVNGNNINDAVRTGLGEVEIYFDTPYANTDYICIPQSDNLGFSVEAFRQQGQLNIRTFDTSGSPADVNFDVICK